MSEEFLAEQIVCDIKVVNRIANLKTFNTADMATILSVAVSTGPKFWYNAQQAQYIFLASEVIGKRLLTSVFPGKAD